LLVVLFELLIGVVIPEGSVSWWDGWVASAAVKSMAWGAFVGMKRDVVIWFLCWFDLLTVLASQVSHCRSSVFDIWFGVNSLVYTCLTGSSFKTHCSFLLLISTEDRQGWSLLFFYLINRLRIPLNRSWSIAYLTLFPTQIRHSISHHISTLILVYLFFRNSFHFLIQGHYSLYVQRFLAVVREL